MVEDQIMYNMPFVSVVMPVYNAEKYILESVQSVLNQTYHNYELIIVDDASTDRSTELITSICKDNASVKMIRLAENGGVSHARNTGIENSKGEYIAFIDSDDIWKADKLKLQMRFMIENSILFSFTSYEITYEDSKKDNTYVQCPQVVNYQRLLYGNPIPCFTVICHRSLLKDYHFEKTKHEDYVLWLQLAKKYTLYGFDCNLGIYRSHSQSISSNKMKAAGWVWDIYRNKEHLGFFKSCYCYFRYAVNGILKHYIRKKMVYKS